MASGRTSSQDSLQGAHIVVTRPAERGESLCRAITAAGGEALLFPTLEITALEPAALPENFSRPGWLVFTSVPSVTHATGLLDLQLPEWRKASIAAIGSATAEALHAAGAENVCLPETGQQHSEGLLACREFQVAEGECVLIIRGEGGRRALDNALQERGAQLHSLAVYRRKTANIDPAPLLARWQAGRLDAIVASSTDGLRALHELLDEKGRAELCRTQLVLPTERMIKLTQQLGIRPEPLVAAGASDEAVLAALTAWWNAATQA